MTKAECKELEEKVFKLKSKIAQYYVDENVNILKSHEQFIGKTYRYKEPDCDNVRYYKIVKLNKYNTYRVDAIKFSYPNIFHEDETLIEIVSLPLWCNGGVSDEPTLKDLTEVSIEEYNEVFDKCVAEIKSIQRM